MTTFARLHGFRTAYQLVRRHHPVGTVEKDLRAAQSPGSPALHPIDLQHPGLLLTDKERALNLVNAGEIKGRFIVDHSTRSILEVPDKQMDAFIKVVTEYPDTPVTSEFPITKGTRVRVVGGPLKGIEGEVEETPNGVQLIVGIQSVICARITITRADVVPIDTP